MTSGEFLDGLQPEIHADLIDGEIVMHCPVKLNHANLVNFLDRLLRSFLDEEPLGGLYRETVAGRLSVRGAFLPAIQFFSNAQLPRLLERNAPIAPVFLCEAISESMEANDRGRKFTACGLHGVQEYWILDPTDLKHRFYRLEGDTFVEFATSGDRIDSVTISGFWARRSWFNPKKLPKVNKCVDEILADLKRARARKKA